MSDRPRGRPRSRSRSRDRFRNPNNVRNYAKILILIKKI